MIALKRERNINILGLLLTGLLIGLAYQTTLLWMYGRYTAVDTYYSHGFLVPLVSLFFIYRQKDLLNQMESRASVVGLIVMVLALFVHVLGTILYVFSVSGFSLYFLIIGVALFLFGEEKAKIIWFPLCFLVFMFPLPLAVIELISFPLKIFAAKVGVWLVGVLGIPVHGEGFNIYIPAGKLLVGNPCSGLRSLIAFLAIGAIFAYIASFSKTRKLLLFISSAPIALLSNIVRIPILILASHYWGLEAAAPDTLVHQGSGILVFVLGFFLLLLTAKVLEWRT